MQVLLEPTREGVRATVLGLEHIVAEGRDDAEALERLKAAFEKQVPAGSRVVEWPQEHPLAKFAGMFKNNPAFDDWQAAIEQRRVAEDLADAA